MPPNIEIEMFELSFLAENSQNVTFSSSFSHFPTVTAISSGNENIYVDNITKVGCTVNSSIVITGNVQVQVMGYA